MVASLYHNWKLRCKILAISKRPGTLLLDPIFIIHERSENATNIYKDLKAKTYHMALKTMLQHTYPSLLSRKIRDWGYYSTTWVFERWYEIDMCKCL